jgi:hypothetical protein
MGHPLHNTIYLGRQPLFSSRRARVALALATLAGATLGWLALRALH